MHSLNTPPWQTSLIAAAQQRSGRRASFGHGRTASEVLPRLYLTDLFTARDEAQLTGLGITHVVSVMENAPMLPQAISLRTLHIPLSDSSDQNILGYLPESTSFIRDALAESPDSRVLVHCLMGISRSATVVCAYLVATTKVTPHEALATVRSKRGIVCPNLGFRQQLEEYATQVQAERGRSFHPAKVGENVVEAIRKRTRVLRPRKQLNSGTISMAGGPVSPSSVVHVPASSPGR